MTTHVTRRRFSGLALGGAASVSVLSKANASEDWATRLQTALDALSTPERQLRLTAFHLDHAPKVEMTAVVELTWTPGIRRRRFFANGATKTAAADALLTQVQESFAPSLV